MAQLAGDPAVAWAEPNALRRPALWTRSAADPIDRAALDPGFPNDPLFRDGRQWGLRNLGPAGPFGGVAGADIHALGGWARSVGSNDVLLGVADTGIDPGHPDLAATMPDGSPRIAYPANVSSGHDRSVLDFFAHGTLVAGVCGALTNNGVTLDSLGIAGVCGGLGGVWSRRRPARAEHADGSSGSAVIVTFNRILTKCGYDVAS